MGTLAAVLLLTCWIWIPLIVLLGMKVLIPALTGKSTGEYARDRQIKNDADRFETEMLVGNREAAALNEVKRRYGL